MQSSDILWWYYDVAESQHNGRFAEASFDHLTSSPCQYRTLILCYFQDHQIILGERSMRSIWLDSMYISTLSILIWNPKISNEHFSSIPKPLCCSFKLKHSISSSMQRNNSQVAGGHIKNGTCHEDFYFYGSGSKIRPPIALRNSVKVLKSNQHRHLTSAVFHPVSSKFMLFCLAAPLQPDLSPLLWRSLAHVQKSKNRKEYWNPWLGWHPSKHPRLPRPLSHGTARAARYEAKEPLEHQVVRKAHLQSWTRRHGSGLCTCLGASEW